MENIRVHVFVEGRVQGVFFRAETRQEALRNNLTGWVRNLYDGRVEAVFEGSREDVHRMVAWCRKGPPHAVVRNVEAAEEDYSGEFKAFSITC